MKCPYCKKEVKKEYIEGKLIIVEYKGKPNWFGYRTRTLHSCLQ